MGIEGGVVDEGAVAAVVAKLSTIEGGKMKRDGLLVGALWLEKRDRGKLGITQLALPLELVGLLLEADAQVQIELVELGLATVGAAVGLEVPLVDDLDVQAVAGEVVELAGGGCSLGGGGQDGHQEEVEERQHRDGSGTEKEELGGLVKGESRMISILRRVVRRRRECGRSSRLRSRKLPICRSDSRGNCRRKFILSLRYSIPSSQAVGVGI